MFDVLSCFEGSVNCNWKWFYQKYFPLGLQLGKYFHWASCSYLEILWIGILINRTVPLTSLLTLCILECIYAWLTLALTQRLIKNKISRITAATSVIKAGVFLVEIKSVNYAWRNCVAPLDQTGESPLNYNYSQRGGGKWWDFKLLTLNIEQSSTVFCIAPATVIAGQCNLVM